MGSKWIDATTKEDMPRHKGGLRRIAGKHREPDVDERGGKSDYDADDKRKKKRGVIEAMNTPMGY